MSKKNTLLPYILIGVGLYFFLQQSNIPLVDNVLSWPTILIIIGVALLLYNLSNRDYQNILGGIIVLCLGIHFYGLQHYSFWIDHWAVYLGIVGIAIIIRSYWLKKGLLSGFILIILALFMIFPIQIPKSLQWINDVTNFIESFWPILLIVFGVYLLRKK